MMIKFLYTNVTNSAMLGSRRLLKLTSLATILLFVQKMVVKVVLLDCLGLLLVVNLASILSACLVKSVITNGHNKRSNLDVLVRDIFALRNINH